VLLKINKVRNLGVFSEFSCPGGRGVPVKRLSLGSTAVLIADEACSAAKATLADVAKGGDPVADKVAGAAN
jgi:hypothetical protein